MSRRTTIFARVENLLRSKEVSVPERPGDRPGDAEPPHSGPLAAPERGIDIEGERTSGHAPGHRRLGPPPEVPAPHSASLLPARNAAWHDIGGRVDRVRRNERRHG